MGLYIFLISSVDRKVDDDINQALCRPINNDEQELKKEKESPRLTRPFKHRRRIREDDDRQISSGFPISSATFMRCVASRRVDLSKRIASKSFQSSQQATGITQCCQTSDKLLVRSLVVTSDYNRREMIIVKRDERKRFLWSPAVPTCRRLAVVVKNERRFGEQEKCGTGLILRGWTVREAVRV
ncbi:hypothetical protein LguiB_010753 [Lonicera macranthoides]